MAAGDAQLYDTGIEVLIGNDWVNDAFYAILLDVSYTPSDAHSTYSDVSAAETTDVDYAPVALTGKTKSTVAGEARIDSDDLEFGTNVSISAAYVAVLKGTAAAPVAGDKLLFYGDLDTGSGNVSSTNSVFAARANANGWLGATHS